MSKVDGNFLSLVNGFPTPKNDFNMHVISRHWVASAHQNRWFFWIKRLLELFILNLVIFTVDENMKTLSGALWAPPLINSDDAISRWPQYSLQKYYIHDHQTEQKKWWFFKYNTERENFKKQMTIWRGEPNLYLKKVQLPASSIWGLN